MIENTTIQKIEYTLNLFQILGIVLILFLTFIFQILFHELPCPLCFLQRVGFLSIAFGFLMNFRFGLHPSHYAISIISALFTSFIALRQITLHIIPGTNVYGIAIFGLHLYTWSFIITILIVIVTTLMLSVDRQYQNMNNKSMHLSWRMHILFGIILLFIIINIFSVLFICGFGECPDNPM